MAVLDLKPLSDEIIQEMGIGPQELWKVKLGDEIFGPFETASLKHYASENEDIFEEAQACRLDHEEWKPFFGQTVFQRRQPQVLKTKEGQKEGPYWLLEAGQKHGPYQKPEVDKKIELGVVRLIDLISTDDGHTWNKIYQIDSFDRRFHSFTELPVAPLESEFQKARAALLEKIEAQAEKIRLSDELAETAHSSETIAKVISFRAEDVPMARPDESGVVSENLKWQLPVAVAVVVTLVTGIGFMTSGSKSDSIDEVASVGEVRNKKQNVVHNPPRNPQPSYSPPPPPSRAPSSYNPPAYNHQNYTPPPTDYTTQIETHHNDYPPEVEHYQDPPPIDDNREPASDHAMGGAEPFPPAESQSLDAAMNNPPPIEEVSDF